MDKGRQSNTLRKFGGPRVYMWQHTLLGGVGACPLRKFLKFRPSEIVSGAFFRPFVVLKWHNEMTIFLVLIRHVTPIVQVTLVLIRHLGVIAE